MSDEKCRDCGAPFRPETTIQQVCIDCAYKRAIRALEREMIEEAQLDYNPSKKEPLFTLKYTQSDLDAAEKRGAKLMQQVCNAMPTRFFNEQWDEWERRRK